MRKRFFLVISIFVVFTCLFSYFSFSINASNKTVPISLGVDNWTSTGKNSRLTWVNNTLLWNPGGNNASIKAKYIPKDWQQFQEIKFTFSSNQNSNNWISVVVIDNLNRYKFSYFTVDSISKKTVNFQIHSLFSAFGGDQEFNWNNIHSFALCSHPNANQNIESLVIEINKISLLCETSKEKDPFLFSISKPVSQKDSIFFTEQIRNDIFNRTSQDKRIDLLLSYCFEDATTIEENISTKQIRNMSLKSQYQKNFGTGSVKEALFKITPKYWTKIFKQSDIFLQEHAINYLLSVDLLRDEISKTPALQMQTQSNIKKICEIELETCKYWTIHYPFGKGNNHVTRAASILGLSSLFLDDYSLQKEMLSFSLYILDEYISFQISEDGVLNEGTHYYTYFMEIFTYFAYAVQTTLGLNLFKDFPFSQKLCAMVHWSISIQKPSGYLPSIDDSWQTNVSFPYSFIIPFFPEEAETLLWCSTNFANQSPIENESWNIAKSLYIPLSLLSNISFCNTIPKEPKRNSLSFFEDSEIVFRNNRNVNGSYLMFCGKKMFSLHEQNDAGHIQISYGNKPLLLESGYGPTGWSSKHRRYYVSSQAHNTCTVDGKGPVSWYNGGVGPIDKSNICEFFTSDFFSYGCMDIDLSISNPDVKYKRTIFYLPEIKNKEKENLFPFYSFVLDSFHSINEHKYSSCYHPSGNLHQVNSSGIHYSDEDKENFIHLKTTQETKLKNSKGFLSNYWDQEVETTYFEFKKTETSTIIESLIFMDSDKNGYIDLIKSETNAGSEYQIKPVEGKNPYFSSWVRDIFLINETRTMLRSKNVYSNSKYCFLREQTNEAMHYYINDGSYLNINNSPIFYSNKRIESLYFYPKNPLKNGIKNQECIFSVDKLGTRFSFFTNDASSITAIFIDNEEISFSLKEARVTVSLPIGNHVLTFQ
ncbi:MAG: heparinase II/III family protein [Caldisericia bacterium]|nr:heparinase II/III family protein [Caldisericia bacterium]